ncbi:MAG TPA: hypothetical protein VI386_21190 [Candidatus Sulfotelmatobacter sp.]|jgi:hypothetical protein
MGISSNTSYVKQRRDKFLRLAVYVLLAGCTPPKATIQITHAPVTDPGGPVKMDVIEGRASSAKTGQHVVLYARSGGAWWIQPFSEHPFTEIQPNSTWKNTIHLGSDYAAVLVEPGYHPALKTHDLPTEGNGVVAINVVKGQTPAAAPSAKVIHFSGYDWTVLDAENDRGGVINPYDPDNAWIDHKGYLHLRMSLRDGRLTCAQVNLTRSLGYGTYTFVVRNIAHLGPSAVLGMYTRDLGGATEGPNELDIEVSRWGNPIGRNAQYIVQPSAIPQNVFRFAAPAGVLTQSFRWEPGTASFQTALGATTRPRASIVSSHVFSSEIPAPATETVYIDLFDLHRSKNIEQRPVEVVIEKFEYLP